MTELGAGLLATPWRGHTAAGKAIPVDSRRIGKADFHIYRFVRQEPTRWRTRREIEAATGRSDRTTRYALSKGVSIDLLVVEGPKEWPKYRLNPDPQTRQAQWMRRVMERRLAEAGEDPASETGTPAGPRRLKRVRQPIQYLDFEVTDA